MAEARKIGTGFIQKQVVIDGNTWNYREIGSGEGERMSQAFARVKLYAKRAELINNKIDNGSVTEEELDKQEEYLDLIRQNTTEAYEILFNCLSDGTEDNKTIREWFDKTPQWKVEKASLDIIRGDLESVKDEQGTEESTEANNESS